MSRDWLKQKVGSWSISPEELLVLYNVNAPYPVQNKMSGPDQMGQSSPFLHWVATHNRQDLVPYMDLSPPRNSPPHRYHLGKYQRRLNRNNDQLSAWLHDKPRPSFPLHDFLDLFTTGLSEDEQVLYPNTESE